MSSGGFGIPLPLPGQKEKRVAFRESERLKLDALKMEERLEKLKVQVSKEKDRRESTSKVGGATWRSARGDTTTAIRGYAKEVQRQVMLSKSMASATLASASLPVRRDVRRPAASLPPPGASSSNNSGSSSSSSSPNLGTGGFSDRAEVWQKDPMSWSVRDTTAWLCSQGLQQYQDRFAKNEISGPILMEIGLDDLDYMGITVLAHRKILLRGVEKLRHGGRSSQPPPPPQPSANHRRQPSSGIANSPTKLRPLLQQAIKKNEVLFSRARRINGSMDSADEEGLGRVMLPSNQRQGGEEPSESLGQGEYDESQAQQSFQDALREWRNAGKKRGNDGASSTGGVPLEREASPETGSEPGQGEDGMWRNPFATPREGYSQPPTKDDKATKDKGGQLWGRLPDEQEEHQSFMEAVDAWRRGSRGDTARAPAPPSSASHLPPPISLPTPRLMSEAGTNTPRTAATPLSVPMSRSNNDTADEGSSPVIKARRNVQEIADRLANQLDEEHRQCRAQLAKQKDEYMRRLAAAQIGDERSREEEAKRVAQAAPTSDAEGKDGGEEKGQDDKGRGSKGRDDDEEEERVQGLTDAEDKASRYDRFLGSASPARAPCEDKRGATSPQALGYRDMDEAVASYGEEGQVVVEEPEDEGEEVYSSVRIEEVGTIMGYTPRRDTGGEEEEEEAGDYCVVEECDSEEEEGKGGEGEEETVSF